MEETLTYDEYSEMLQHRWESFFAELIDQKNKLIENAHASANDTPLRCPA